MDADQNGEPEQLEEQANAADEGGVVDSSGEDAPSEAIPEEVITPPLSDEQIEAAQEEGAREPEADSSDQAPAETPDQTAPSLAEGE